jgi:hypothetical protein
MISQISQFVIYSLFLIGCSTTKPMGSMEISSSTNSFPLTLKNAIAIERHIGSKDISYEYTVGIDTSLYPNKPHFGLTKVKRFSRPSTDRGMAYTIEYFATSDDSIRTILHEWNVAEEPNDSALINSASLDSHSPQTNVINAFNRKFAILDSTFTNLLGKPAIQDIKSSFLEETERDDVKWQGLNQLNAYLLMFKRDINTYRQIRVIVYLK